MLELLSPAGSMEALRAAVCNGADAVYLGADTFNARINARNFSAPEPVILTKKALSKNGNKAQVLVDNQVAVDNITRFAENKGLKVSVTKGDGEFKLTIG